MAKKSFDLGVVATFEKAFTVISHEPAFPLSDKERALIEAAPFRHTGEGWRRFAGQIHECVVHGYSRGEMDFRRTMEVMRLCSLGCHEDDRVELLALTADRILRLKPQFRNSSPPPYPRWQRRAAVDLVLYLEYLNGDQSSTTIRQEALAWLRVLGLATENSVRQRELSGRTLQRWVQAHRRTQGRARPAGRRPN